VEVISLVEEFGEERATTDTLACVEEAVGSNLRSRWPA